MKPTESVKDRPGREIPGPSAVFSLRYARELQRDVLGLSEALRKEYGGIVRVPIPGKRVYVVSDAELVHDILVRTERDFLKGPANVRFEPLLGKGLVLSNGNHWKRQRRLMNPFFSTAAIRSFESHIQGAISEVILADRSMRVLDIHEQMQRVTLQVILRSLFSGEAKRESETLFDCFSILSGFCIKRFFNPFPLPLSLAYLAQPRVRNAHRMLEELLKSLIANRRASGDRPSDLLTMFIEAEDAETAERMTDEEIRDELMTVLFAGFDTTSFGLTMTLWLLAQNADAAESLRKEAQETINGDIPTEEESQQLHGIRNAFQEAMRIYPPVYMVNRTPIKSVRLGDFGIPKGALLLLSIWDIHRNPEHWPEPLAFLPERFADSNAAGEIRSHFLPFGGGSRACLGKNLALMEGPMILGTVLKNFRFQSIEGSSPELMTGATLGLKKGLSMKLEPL